MKLPRYAILAILVVLYAAAAGARFHRTATDTSPYFSGASALGYRHAMAVADGKSLVALDAKAGWPDGYRPAAYRAAGAEYFAGWAFRAARWVSEVDGRVFTSRLIVLLSSLCVFTLYAFARRLWDCQAAGLLAAGFVAVFVPLVDATNGRRFDHAVFAVLLATVHATLWLRAHRRRSAWGAAAAAIAAFLVAAVWELGLYYIAAAAAIAALAPAAGPARRWGLVAHAAAALAACVVLPYFRELRAAFSWPVVVVVAAAAAEFLPGRGAARTRRALVIAAVAVVATVALAPLRAGAAASVPVMEYAWLRLRYLAGKPTVASLVSDAIRYAWSADHAPPSAHALLRFFLPVAFLAAAVATSAGRLARERRAAFVVAAAIGGVAAIAYAFDRSAAALAAVALAPILSASGRSISTALATRAPLVAAGAYLVAVDFAFPLGAANPTFQIAKSGGFAYRDPHRFLWVSLENTDRELVRFVASRTSVSDAFLGPDDVTALLLTFAGRTSVPLAGAATRAAAQRNVELARAVYADEASLYETCRRLDVQYVLYSIDMLLDATRYSPRYLAAIADVGEDSAVHRMHFDPESLRRFTLVYENAHHRLYKVTPEAGTLFLTDHPPVYQRDVLDRVDGDVEAFARRVVELVLTYRDARVEAARGDVAAALKKLDWCLQVAPQFTLARVARGTTLTLAGRLEEARDELLSVIAYAPDDAPALYHTAYVLAALGETDRAKGYLEVFFATATDPDLVEKARLLKTFVDQNIPVTPHTVPQ